MSALEDCYRVCGDRSKLVLKDIGFRYSNALLDKKRAVARAIRLDVKFALDVSRSFFGVSRYSDGSWPVLYTATEDETSIFEVAYHARREWITVISGTSSPPSFKTSKKLLYTLQVDTSTQQVLSFADARLVDADYSYCHSQAASARSAGYKSIKVPSARRRHGVCVPVFDRSAIRTNGTSFISCSIRWYPSADRLAHSAVPGGGSQDVSLWRM